MSGDGRFYPLTYPQKSIWYLEKLNPGTGIGNIAATLKVDENLSYVWVNQAANLLVKHNDGFRLRFRERDGTIEQYVAEYTEHHFDYFDFSADGREKLYTWDQEQTRVPFDRLDDDLFYFAHVKIDDHACGIFVRIHHLIADAWSVVQIANDIMTYYRLLETGQMIPPEDNPSYLDFIASEQAYLQSERFGADKLFWRRQFADLPELTTLKNKTTSRIGMQAQRRTFCLPEKLVHKIKHHCQENRTSIFALFFAALCIYINRVKDLSDIVIGTPVLNRTNVREKRTIGMFISTVPLRIQIDGKLDFVTFSQLLDKAWFSVLKHQKYPYDCLIRDLKEHVQTTDKLFDVALSYQNAKISKGRPDVGQEARWHFNAYQVESLYIHINDREDDGKIVLNYDFQIDAFYLREIEFIHDHIVRLLWHALDNPARPLAQLHMLSEQELRRVLVDFNRTDARYPHEATISALFEQQVRQSPHAVALVWGRETLSYQMLNEKANFLARALRKKGVGPEDIVALLLPRTPELIIAMLAVVKAGGAYLPIDPDYPEERIRYMLDDSKTEILLTRGDLAQGLAFMGEVVDVYRMQKCVMRREETTDLLPVNKPQDLLYVIYTSGSTGNPKGAMIEHCNVVRLLFNDAFPFDFGRQDCWTLFHSYCFDFSVWEIYGALLYGGRLVMVPKEATRDSGLFLDLLKRERVTILNQTPAAFYNLIDAEQQSGKPELSLRTVIFGGEALKPIMLQPFRARYPKTRLVNMYGITETTVHVTWLDLDDAVIEQNSCNVGRPIPTLKVYILDRQQNPLPIGVPGELCVSGDGVGRGYLNNPGLTAERFITNPFMPGERLYRSGDLARFFAQGDIEYLGRIDNQVKIRGHRIELGEIESRLLKFDKIKEAIVLTRDAYAGSKQLCAYYVAQADCEPHVLRAYLARFLPDYMIPAFFVRVDQMPLNGNGKIDRRRLPVPDAGTIATDVYIAPQNALEADLARIWGEVLEIGKVGITDNFFHLGGDSLSAMVIVSRVGRGMVYADLYNNPTIKTLAVALAGKTAGDTERMLLRLADCPAGADCTIICFPYGGGNGTIYKDLANAVSRMSGRFCVYSVDLPRCLAEPQHDPLSVRDLATRLVAEIKTTVQGELIFYGHCVGSALTLETARLLKEERIKVRDVYLGGTLPPQRWRWRKIRDPWQWVSDRNIVRFLYRIGLPRQPVQQEILETMVRAFRRDVRNYYRFFGESNLSSAIWLDAPIHCVIGDKDPVTLNYQRKYRRWSRYSKRVGLHVIKDAKHYFLKTNADELAGLLTGRP